MDTNERATALLRSVGGLYADAERRSQEHDYQKLGDAHIESRLSLHGIMMIPDSPIAVIMGGDRIGG